MRAALPFILLGSLLSFPAPALSRSVPLTDEQLEEVASLPEYPEASAAVQPAGSDLKEPAINEVAARLAIDSRLVLGWLSCAP